MQLAETVPIVGTCVLAAIFILLGYFYGRRSNKNMPKSSSPLNSEPSSIKPKETSSPINISSKRIKSKKKREIHQEFTHSWIIGTLKGHTSPILDMDLSNNGKFLVSCAEDRTVMLWCTSTLTSKDRKSLRINVEYDYATHVRWSPDGKAFIIHKSQGNNVEVYKIAKRPNGFIANATKALEFPTKHEEEVVGIDIACTGRFIMTCSKKNDPVIWDLKGQILATIDTHLGTIHRAKISPCGRFVVVSGFTPDVKVFEVNFTKTGDFKNVTRAFDLAGHTSGVMDFGFTADSSKIATVSKDESYRLYNVNVEYQKGEDPKTEMIGKCEGAEVPTNLAISPNGEVLVISHGSSLTFYRMTSGKLDTHIEDIFNGPVKCLAFDSLGEHLLVAGDKHIKIFRNVPGYRASIESAREKLKQRQTATTKERLENVLAACKNFLYELNEWCP